MPPFYETCRRAEAISGTKVKISDLAPLYQEWYKLRLQAAFSDPVFR